MTRHDAQTLSTLLGGRLIGENRPVATLRSPEQPTPDAVVVLGTPAEAETLNDAEVAVLVVPEALHLDTSQPLIRVADTRLALAQLSKLFDERPRVAEGVCSSATVHDTALLAEDVHLGAGVVVGAGTRLGRGTRAGPGCVLGAGVRVGEDCTLHAHVTLYDGVTLHARVTLHSGVVVGADGFGYARGERGSVKIHHLGGVVLEDDVEVGANTCIDRGTLQDTRVGARSKIDNLCQIGHNVTIGPDCLIAGTVGIAGSTVLGARVTVGGSAGIGDHLNIGDDARVAGRAGVIKDIPAGETWAGFPARPHRAWLRGLYLQGKLETLWQAFKAVKEPHG